MGINMGQHLAGHVASVSRDLAVLYRGDRGIHRLVAVLLPQPIQHVIQCLAMFTCTPEALESGRLLDRLGLAA